MMLCVAASCLIFTKCAVNNAEWNSASTNNFSEKHRGAHVFGIQDSSYFATLKHNNIDWITIVPWGFQKDYQSVDVSHGNGDTSYMRKSDDGYIRRITLIRNAGFKVFVKPHVWVDKTVDRKWRSDIFPQNDEAWDTWKKTYKTFIFRYAVVAEKAQAEMFCIGTEFTRLAIEKPDYWKSLIEEVKTIYSGKITYAANWYEEYEKITFWDQLDFIGIQAYFPLTQKNHPSKEELSNGWNKYLPSISSVAKQFNKKVLFTEMGYKSTADAAIEPWLWAENQEEGKLQFSKETQTNCYEVFFNTIWNKKWFAGVHLWQMRADFENAERYYDLDFTPQGKPALKVIAEGFKKIK